MLTRRDFLAGSASALAAAARGQQPVKKALVAITLDLEMSRNFPTWDTTHWDYEKGNLNDETKKYAVEAARRYRVIPKAPRRASREVDIGAGEDEDSPEVISGSLLDLAAPVLEELSLLLDPYPRAPGVTFDPPKDESKPADNPFAVLAKLKVPPPKEPGAGG